ncbi:SH3 domain-containing protein [Solibacillus sp. FSL K6-1523]|uniref:SH3 domain-containing protein n=1 Tax=Solibacillus sp. FSL K6-1523 TaxID=2921471 RepID=UPI0030F89527
MKKLVMLVLALFVFSVSFVPQTLAEEIKYYTIVPEDGTLMTASADANGMKIMTLKQGTRVAFIRQEAGWTKIDYNGRLGWVKNETLTPFSQDLLPIYSTYYKKLDKTVDLIYALVADFTQDGVEDLYVVTDANPSKGQYVATIYSGEKVIYQKNLKDGLTILKNSTDYYLFHHAQKNAEKKYKLADLNDQAKADYYEVSGGKDSFQIATNTYLNSYYIVQSGNKKVEELTLTHEQVASKDYTGGKTTNDFGETVYQDSYSLSRDGKTTTLLEKEFDELFAHYEKAKGAKIIYSDDYQSASLAKGFSYKVERTKQEILNLALKVFSDKKQIEGIVGLDELKVKLAQSLLLEIPYDQAIQRNAATYVKSAEKGIVNGLPGYDGSFFTQSDVELKQEGMHYFERAPIDAVIYDFYGVKIDTEEFNNLASVDFRYLDEQTYEFPVEELEEQQKTYTYRQLIGIESLETGYEALQYVDYEMPIDVAVSESNENMLIAGDKLSEGYVLLKRLPFKSGVKWVYVDTVEYVDGLNVDQYKTYESTLDIVQKFVAEQQLAILEQESPVIAVAAEKERDIERELAKPQGPSILWGLLAAGMVLLIGAVSASFYIYRKKREHE